MAKFTPEEKELLESQEFVVRPDRATYSLLNPEGRTAIFIDNYQGAFCEVVVGSEGEKLARFWATNAKAHWSKSWEAEKVEDFPFEEIKQICDKDCEKHLPPLTKNCLIKTEKLTQYSDAPVVEWEAEVKRLQDEREKNKKVEVVFKVGYLIKYPTGMEERLQQKELPKWIKNLLPINTLIKTASPWGEVEISPVEWEEEIITEEAIAIVYPPKPEVVQGFDFDNAVEVAAICNEVFKTRWTWGDVDCRRVKDGCKTFEYEGKILKIFPDRCEVYEIILMSKEEIISSLREEIRKLQQLAV